MGLFGTKVKTGQTTSGGGLSTQSTGGPSDRNIITPPSLITSVGSSTGVGTNLANTLGRTVSPINTSTIIKFNQLQRRTAETLRYVNGDAINVAETRIQNEQFRPIVDSGVHNFRPEIILNAEFNTIWELGELTYKDGILFKKNSATGDFINFQFQTKQLRQETLTALIKNIQNTLGSQVIFNDVKKEYNDQLNAVGQDLSYLESIIANIAIIKNAFDIKNIPEENYETKTGGVLTKTHTLRQLLTERMNFTPEQYDSFSNTKILLQMLFDLDRILSSYSVNLIDLKDNDRANDASPVKIDRTYNTSNAFEFNIDNFSSSNTAINASESSFFNTFLAALPPNPNDKIKLLTYLLAKEYSMSRGLGDSANQPILKQSVYSKIKSSNPIKDAIGIIGDTIFETPIGSVESLASLMYINPGNSNVKVLTFENKFVDSDDQQYTYVPGTSFFTDSILTVDGKTWNANSLISYVDRYNTILRSVRTMIESIVGLYATSPAGTDGPTNTISSIIDPEAMNTNFLLAINSSYESFTTANTEALISNSKSNQANVQMQVLLEYQIDYLNKSIIGATDREQISNLNSQIATIRERLTALNLPSLDENIKISLDKLTIMTIFKYISRDHADIKLLLFQFCLLAGMSRNIPNTNINDIFYLLAVTEIDNVNKLSDRTSIMSLYDKSTIDGNNLIDILRMYATKIEQKILATLSTLQPARERSTQEGILKYYIQQSSISSVLLKCAKGSDSYGDSNLIYQFITLSNQFFNSGRIDNNNVHLIQDGTNRTKYNNLSCSTQLLFVFEILCQYAQSYGVTEFISQDDVKGRHNPGIEVHTIVAHEDKGSSRREGRGSYTEDVVTYDTTGMPNEEIMTLGISVDYSTITKISQAIKLLTNSSSDEDKETARKQNNSAFISLEANKNRIAGEYETVRDILSNFKIIGDNLQSSLAQVQSFFNQKALQDFLKNSPVVNLNLLKNYSQLRLSSYIYNNIKERTAAPGDFISSFGGNKQSSPSTQNDLIVSETTTPSEYNALVAMLSDTNNKSLQCLPTPELPPDIIKRNNKILTIGIPAGFSRELADRVNKRQITAKSFKDKQSDVVVLNIYLRNLKFNDIVFKPFRYVFDLSLFATKKDFVDCDVMSGENINDIINRISLTDLESPFNSQKITRDEILSDQKYDFLNDAQKNDIVKNHVTSYLLEIYLQYITGIKTCEEIFLEPMGGQRQLSTKAKTIIDTYSKQTYGIIPNTNNIIDIITSNTLPEGLKDTYRMLTYGSLVFNANEVRNKVLTPKLFDRIFTVPINVNNAEIDYRKTLSTSQGKNAWSKEYTQSFIRIVQQQQGEEHYYINANEIDDFIINDMFVAVETANDTEAQDRSLLLRAQDLSAIIGGRIL